MPPLLPEDVLMDILSRLPVNSLLRFKSVSKTWLSLITDPRFISTHLNNNLSKPKKTHSSLLILRSIPNQQHYHHSDSQISLSFLSNQTTPIELSPPDSLRGEIQLFGPCNGIVCLTDNDNIVLSNPSIREFKLLPPPPFSYPRNLKSLTEGIGFGFDSSVSDYKVVKISQLYSDDEGYYNFDSVRVEIYSLSTDSWRESQVSVPLHIQYMPCFELWFNGAFHFYGNNGNDFESILAFDTSEEVFNQISFPGVCFYPDGKYRSLGVLNDKLALVLYDAEVLVKQLDIWVMNEYGVKESWTQLFSVGPLPVLDWPLGFWKDSEFLFENHSTQLVSYNLDSHEITEHEIHGNLHLRVLPYTESLISIKRGDFLGRTVMGRKQKSRKRTEIDDLFLAPLSSHFFRPTNAISTIIATAIAINSTGRGATAIKGLHGYGALERRCVDDHFVPPSTRLMNFVSEGQLKPEEIRVSELAMALLGETSPFTRILERHKCTFVHIVDDFECHTWDVSYKDVDPQRIKEACKSKKDESGMLTGNVASYNAKMTKLMKV